MIKFKHLFYTVAIAAVLYSCGSENNNSFVDNFDHEAQAIKDQDSLVKFLKNNYYDVDLDSVKVIDDNQISLFDDSKLVTKKLTEYDVDYTLYYYVNRVGEPDIDKGFPSVTDSVYVKYRGQIILDNDSLSNDFDNNTTWLSLSQVIRGWTYSFTDFKGGNNVTVDGEKIKFDKGGKGILFIPSGLGYRNGGVQGIVPNSNLMFTFELWDFVEGTDDDQDGISSINEDVDGDGDPRNDDTDGNGRANYLDADDDGDGKLTKDEDANGDGDPRNDFSDPKKPTIPDYLNRDIR